MLVGLFTVASAQQSPPAKQAKPNPKSAPAKKGNAPAAKSAAVPPAPGGGQPTLLGQFGDWGAYTANAGGKQICYALAKPSSKATEPPNRPRDPAYIFVSTRPAENVRNEISIVIGYPFKPGSEANVDIGSAKYAMYTQNDGAWIKNAAEEARMVDAMRRGSDLVVTGESGRAPSRPTAMPCEGSRRRSTASRRSANDAQRHARPPSRGQASGSRRSPRLILGPIGPTCGSMTTILDRPAPRGFVEKTALERYVAPAKPSLVGMSRAALADALGTIGVPEKQRKMRVQQLWNWIYVRGVTRFDDMTSVSKELRAALEARFTLERPEVVAEQVSVDGTRKWLLRLPGEHAGERPHEVECVYIPDAGRATLCVSSQVGCTLTCSFCHTGTQRLVRNLTPGEIVGQVMVARDRLGDWPGGTPPEGAIVPTDGGRFVTNIVMMGMGEPLYNFDAVRDALLVVADGDGIGISKRRITLSTSGVVPNIARAGAEIGTMLAISLHAVRDDLRDELVPLNRKYPIAELLDACRNYPGVSNARRITFEYVMLKGVNDSLDDAKTLVKLLKGIPAKINLIPFNPWPGTQYECSDWEQIEKFSEYIFNAGYSSPVRTPRGRDILAACGQLKSATEKLSARERMALRAMAMTD